jgi:hypothetical protein
MDKNSTLNIINDRSVEEVLNDKYDEDKLYQYISYGQVHIMMS